MDSEQKELYDMVSRKAEEKIMHFLRTVNSFTFCVSGSSLEENRKMGLFGDGYNKK